MTQQQFDNDCQKRDQDREDGPEVLSAPPYPVSCLKLFGMTSANIWNVFISLVSNNVTTNGIGTYIALTL